MQRIVELESVERFDHHTDVLVCGFGGAGAAAALEARRAGAAVMVLVSRMTEVPSEEQIKDLTFQTMTAEHRRESRESWGNAEVVWSGVVLVLILMAYLYFTG